MDILTSQEVSRRRERGRLLQLEGNLRNLTETRFAVLSTFNADLLPPFLTERLEQLGLYGKPYLGGFGQMAQEVLDPGSGLYRAAPEAVLLLAAVEDLLAPLFAQPLTLTAEQAEQQVEERVAECERLVSILLERLPAAACFVVVPSMDRVPFQAILDPTAGGRGQAAVTRLVESFRGLGALSPRVVAVDWDWHTRATGMVCFRDERLWYLARMRLNPLGLATLAELVAGYVAAYRGAARKVAVVDLDNTLWGGVVGEVGVGGLVLGEEGLGLAFQDFQRELLCLREAGVVLAICSKNNPEDAWEVFDRHPSMVLRRDHFAAVRVNWQDKATNLLALSEELNLGIDSFVFLDDNPVERQWVRGALPQVAVPDLPEDPVYRPAALRRLSCFQRIALTEADVQRSETYRAQGLRRQLQESVGSMDEFLASLEQEITIEPVHPGSAARAAQMCQRTNQFNLTTYRYTVGDIEQMIGDPAVEAYTVTVSDRYGNSGITGFGVLRFNDVTAEIDTFLLSCRVLGRRVEHAFLSFLTERARDRGVHYLMGRYLPTAKNVQVAGWYSGQGFEQVGEGLFRLNLEQPLFPPMTTKVKEIANA